MTLLFNSIPSGLVAPIFSFEVNSGGAFESASRMLLVGLRDVDGPMPLDTPIYAASQEAVDALAGDTSVLRDMYRRARANAPAEEIWIAAVSAAGTTADWTVTITDPVPGQGLLRIAGEPVVVSIAAGDAAADVAGDLAAAINTYWDPVTRARLPVTASVETGNDPRTADLHIAARRSGAIFSDLDIWIDTTVENALVGVATVAVATVGTGQPDLSSLLGSLGDEAFDTIVSPFSDADNLGRYAALMSDVAGRWAWNRQVYGHVWTCKTGTAADLVTAGLALADERHMTILTRIAAAGDATPSWGWIAAYAARQAPWLHDGANGNVSRNMTGLALELVVPPRDRSKWPSFETRNTFLRSRLSTWKVEGARVVVDKAVTTMKNNALGQLDVTFRDVQSVYQVTYALRFLRARLSYEHGQKALADENPAGVGSVSTPADIKATFIHGYEDLVRRGVLENADGFAVRIAVERNPDAAARVDVLAPLDRVNPLDVLAANATLYAQYR